MGLFAFSIGCISADFHLVVGQICLVSLYCSPMVGNPDELRHLATQEGKRWRARTEADLPLISTIA